MIKFNIPKNYNLIIGSHVSLKAPRYLLDCIKDSIEYDANAFMIYTGAPQTTKRVSILNFKIAEANARYHETNFTKNNVIVHAPYIINLTNPSAEKRKFAIEFLTAEMRRCEEMGIGIMVLHPGNHLNGSIEQALQYCWEGINEILANTKHVKIALETMAGKGTEICFRFSQLATIIKNVKNKNRIGVCLDSCHMHDAGYDLIHNVNGVINEFDKTVGVDKILAIHVNDSKNPQGARKDRHENIGYGYIGFLPLMEFIYHPKLNGKIKILETPYVNGKPPYKTEINQIKTGIFISSLKQLIA